MQRTTHALRVTLAAAALVWAAAARAQFPITESFMNATAPGWTLLGNAVLTASAAGGSLDAPGSGWLRLTSATGNQAASAIYDTAFASTSGIAISFDYADYGGTGADGFTFYLIDGTTASPTVGAYGGPLGYSGRYGNITTTRCANGTMSVVTPGVTNGYVGIGFDEFGNFSNCESGWNALSTTAQQPQSVVIRGSGSLSTAKSFKYLTSQRVNVAPFNSTIDGTPRASARRARVSIINERISVAMDFGAGYQTVINAFNLRGDADQAALPLTFKMGISGSTGGSTNIHEIRNVRVELPANLTLGQTVTPGTVSVTGTVTFTITITNDATNAALGSSLTDAFPAGLSNVSWTATTTGGATVGRASGTGNLAETVNLPRSSSVTYTVTATVTAAAAGTTLSNTVTLAPPAGVANLLSNTVATNLTVNKMNSATALASSANPSRFGQPVTLTATVTAVAPGSGTPAGTVTFLDGATSLGTAALNASGVATLTTSALAVGTHSLTASYGGAANFNASSSAPALSQVVNQALTATVLASGANPSVAGQAVTLTATVTVQAPGAGTPGGTVTFLDGGVSIGTAALNASGVATLTTSALAVGTHSLTASYGGAASFATSTSPALSQVVDRVTPAAVVASGSNPSRFGQAVTFNATLTPVAPGTGTPTGTVTFLDGGVSIGTATLNASGVATLATSALPAGSRAITVSYPGDARFLAVTSAALTQVVNAAATSSALASATNPSVTGQAVTFTVTVTATAPGGGTPSGQVGFFDGATSLGTAALDASGVATLTTSALAAGSHTITAAYVATASHLASTSPVVTQVVNPAATQTTLAGAGGTPVTGQPRIFTATVTAVAPGAGTPGGTVTFSEGAAVLGTVALDAAGTASLPVALAAGSHTLTATYGGSAAFDGSSGTAAAPVDPAATATALTAGPTPALFGESVLLEASVSPAAPGAGAPTGTVTFLDGAAVLGTATLDAAGHASLTVSTLAVGGHALSAAYGGDAGFLGSTSPQADVAVVPAPTTTVVASSLLTATFGDPLTFTADVAVVAPGAGTPGGTVRFFAGAVALGDGLLDAAGRASLAVPGGTLVAGAHQITAAYLGDGAFQGSTSAPITQSVARAATAVAVAGPGPTVTGQAATFTATVTVPAGLRAAGGTVTFLDGAAFLGTATLDAAGQATFTTAALAPGLHSITATYSGEADYAGSASPAAPHQVDPAATATTLAAAPSPSVFGAPVTLDATVTATAPGAGTPGGTVTFLDGLTVLGSAALDAAGQATFSAALSGGPHALTARYEGSAAFASSTSAPLAQLVDPAPTSLALSAAPSPSVLGELVTLSATITSAVGTPAGTVTFRDGADVLGTVPVGGGTASLTLSTLAIGPHALTADYSGTSDVGASSGAASHLVTQAAADVALVAAPSPAVTGQPVLLTVLVTARAPATGTPSGTVRLLDGATVLGTATLAGGVATFTTADLAVGVHALTAEFLGDAGFLPGATVDPTLLAVDPAATASALAASAPVSVFTEPVTFTATVTVLAPGAGLPTGTVTFAEGTTTLGTAAVEPDGTAALTLPALPVGPHDVVATYGGDPSFALSVSDPVRHLVLEAAIAVNVSVTASPSVAGQPVTFTVTVTPVAPALGPVAGSVTLRGAGPDLGPAPLDGAGQATFTTALTFGTYAVVADFAGPGFAPTSSAALAHQVDPAATATTLAATPAPSISGEPVRLTATVAVLAPGAGIPVGTVTFLDGGSPIGAGVLDAGGVATLDAPLLAGAHALTAAYLGDVAFLPSTSTPLAHQANPGATATTAAAAPSPAVYGEPLTFTADVSVLPPALAPAAGLVTFTVDGLPVGGVVINASQAVLPVPPGLGAGLHQVVATFAGTAELSGSASAPVALLVTAAPVTLALAASPSPGVAGEPTVLRATASAAFGVPAGTVTFTDGGTVLGTAALDPTGAAELLVGPLGVGAHALAATLPAASDYGAAAAATSLSVDRAPSTTDLSAAPAAAVTGQAVTFTATVTPASPAAGVPGGTVTFLEGATVLGTGTLVPAGAGAQATFTTAALPTGLHAVTAAFPGDAALLLSSSAAAPVTVSPAATTLALSAAPSPSVFGQAVTLTVQVAVVAPGAGTPIGSVTFRDGATVLGTGALDAAGQATLTTAALAGSAHTLSAGWPGDGAFLGAGGGTSLDVAAAPTATALQALPVGSALGEPVTLLATVTALPPGAGTPAGTVTFREGATVLGTASLSGGAASISLPSLALGAHALTADYAGSADFDASAGSATHTVGQAAADVALAAAPNPAVTGQPVTLTVLLTPRAGGSGTPTGSVRILDGGVLLGTVTLAGGVATLDTAALPVGVHALTAEYDGDASFVPSATAAATLLTVDPAATATALAASAPVSVFTEPVTFTATVTVVAPGAGAPAGTVTFAEGATTLGTAAVQPDGTAALVLPALPVGPHDLTATYGGDPSFALSVSDPVHHDVAAASVLVAVASAPSPSAPGQAVTFTVSVTPITPALGPATGTVTLREGAAVLGTATLDAAGQATFTTSALPAGAHTLAADFSGPGFADATSADLVHLVAAGASTTAVTASPSPATYGQAVTLSATVEVVAPATATPAGTVDFLVDGAAAGSAPISAGQATLVLPAGVLHGGLHQVSASYAGSADLAGSTSPAVPLLVAPAPVTLALEALPPTPVAGQPVTLRAIAASAPGTPGGLVTFTDGTTALGAAPLDAAGVATLPVGPLAVGSHELAASLPASADFGAGASAASLEVARAASLTTLAADLPGAISGQPVTFTATVSALAPGAALPAGEVTFLDGTTVLGTAAVGPGGVATLALATLPPGAHAVIASFPGDAALAGSASAPALVTVGLAPTALALVAAPSPSVTGQAVTLTAQVTVPDPGAGTPAGQVTFLDGAAVLGAAALDAAGRASLSTSALAPGPHALTASWPGDAALLGAEGAASHTVGLAPTSTVVTAAPATSTFGQAVTFTAVVAPAGAGAGVPTGTVTFHDGAALLGTAALDASGRASLTPAALPAGRHDVTAAYGGDAAFEPSAGATPATADVGRAPSQVALQAAPSPATAGQAVTLTATVTSGAGTPGGTVTFLDGTAVLGTATLDGAGVATLTTTLGAGEHALTATAGGDADHLPATGEASLTVAKAAVQVAVASSRNPSRWNWPVTFTATLSAEGPTSGAVEFWDDSAPAPLLLGTAPVAGGQAVLTRRDLAKGTHPIRARYLGTDLLAVSDGSLAGGQVVENTPPVAGAGTALALGGPDAPASAARVTVPVAGSPVDAAAGTVELWARAAWSEPSQVGPSPTLARLAGAAGVRWLLGVAPDRRHVEVTVGAATASIPAALDDGAWHHLALVGEPGGTTLLVDGLEAGSFAEPFGAGPADELRLGEGFVGELDELRTWSSARTPAELAAAARRPLRGDEAGLTGLWRFDEGGGRECLDAGPSHLDGAVATVAPAEAAPAAFAPSQAWRHRRVDAGEAMDPAAAGYDADGDPVTVTVTAPPAHGTASADATALTVGYLSAIGYGGPDRLTFQLSDGAATGDYTLEIEVAAPAACTATPQCGDGQTCLEGTCVPSHRLDVRAGGCGCGSTGGGALALWSVVALALLRRRRPALAAARRLP